VTGATWGIGYGFSVQLAKRGMNVVLVARNEEKLKEVAEELKSKYGVETKTIVVDFNSADPSIYKKVEDELQGLTVTLLVNNVGINTRYPKFFHEHTTQEMDDMVHVNIDAPNHMTHIILPQMRQRKFGTIINLSSASALDGQSPVLFPVYAATKAYNMRFSRALSEEVARDGVEVLCINPYFVTSKMSRTRNTNPIVCSEETLAIETLNKLGYGMKQVIPWINHRMQFLIISKIPFVKQMAKRTLLGLRKRAMRKDIENEKQAAKQQKSE